MGKLAEAVKAASSVVFGTGAWTPQAVTGTPAGWIGTMDAGVARSIVDSMDAGDLYATQPHLRTVVSFIARNGAQLGRHVYEKSEDGRKRVAAGPLVDMLERPNDYMSSYDLFNMLFSELALYDMAVWVPVLRDGRWQIDPIPGEWIVGITKATAFQMASYTVQYPTNPLPTPIPAKDVIVFRGYSPEGFQRGSSAVRALRATLAEQVAAINFREQMWRRGGRVGMYMTRPADAAEWSPEAKSKFIQAWRAQWSGDGQSAGSTPLLEDGMELKRVGFNAKEEQWLEAATLSLSTVAGAYHVPPAMVGVQGAMSFASVKEFRKMLYTETMGPSIAQVESTINTFLAPFIGAPANQYLELNIQEKLQGDFEEQAQVMQAAVGGPWMTVNEARQRANMTKIDGGDDLLAPLNMGAAGNSGALAGEPIDQPADAAAVDAPPAAPEKPAATIVVGNLTADEVVKLINAATSLIRAGFDPEASLVAVGLDPVRHLGLLPITVQKPLTPDGEIDTALVEDVATTPKASSTHAHKRGAVRPSDRQVKALADEVNAFFKRQQRAVTAKLGAKDPNWWNQKAWNKELSGILLAHSTAISSDVARATARKKKLNPDDYSVGQTANFLKAVADSRADLINSTTRDHLKDAIDNDKDGDRAAAVNKVFDETYSERAPQVAGTLTTMLASWAVTEVARQLLSDRKPRKTWLASGLPNSRHAGLDGETVGIDETFSNGAKWPGDPELGAEEVANCGCGVDIDYD